MLLHCAARSPAKQPTSFQTEAVDKAPPCRLARPYRRRPTNRLAPVVRLARSSMSRPAASVHRFIKAYEVGGWLGEKLDEKFVAEMGAGFARLVSSGASQVVIGHDMRASSPLLA